MQFGGWSDEQVSREGGLDHDLSSAPDAIRTVTTTRLSKGFLPRRCPECKGTLNRGGRLRRPVTFVVTYRGDLWEGVEVYHEDCL